MKPESCRLLDWDSSFFGLRIARVSDGALDSSRLADVEAYCAAERIDCAYFLADAGDVASAAAAQEAGFRCVDIRVTLERSAPGDPADNAPAIRAARPDDVPALREIAAESHRDSRFYADGRFPLAACDRLYAVWIERSCAGWAQAVRTAEVDGAVGGYVTCHTDGATGSIGLIAVGRNFRRRGLGEQLVRGALDYFREEGIQSVSVVTQGRNIASQRLYQRCGFVTSAVQLWYHRWFSVI